MSSSDRPTMPSLTSVLVLHSSCHEKDAATPEIAAFESAWRQLVATAKLSCDMILIPDMAVAPQQQQHAQNELDAHRSVVKFRNELLDPCGTYNVFSLSNLVANSYILSLTDCRLRPTINIMPSSSVDILLPALPVPSTFHFTWNVSEVFQADNDADGDTNVNTNAYAEIRVDLDVTKAKRQFRKVWQTKESAKMSSSATTTNTTVAEEQKEEEDEEKVGEEHAPQHSTSTETKQVPPILVDNESYSYVPVVNLPSCPAWEMPPLSPAPRTGSIAYDPHFKHLETLMESELNDINRILSFLAVTGLVLFVSFLWTAFVHVSHTQSHSRSRASQTPQKTPGTRSSKYKQQRQLSSTKRTVPMESISMQAISGTGANSGNLSPLSLDTILAAQGNCHKPSPSSPSALRRQVKASRAEETPSSTITYGPKQRSSRRSRQPPLAAVPNQDHRNEVDDSSLSPCSKLAQQWSRDKPARRNLRRDGASRGVEESSIVTEGLATATATAATSTASTETTKFLLPPVQARRPVLDRSSIDMAAAADVSVPFYGKSNDSFPPEITSHAAPVSAPLRETTENTRNAATSISIPEEFGLQQLLSPATVTPGPAPRLRPAPSTVDQNHDSSFVHEYWGARAM
jgi:hypothetical protein